MTTVQKAARWLGVAFLGVALLGFLIYRGSTESDPQLAPRIFGLFPVNLLHNLVHLVFGVWGVVAARSFGAARSYCRISGVLYLGLAVLGFITPSMFGLVPIGSHDIWLHALLGAVLAYFGFTARDAAPRTAH